MYKKIGVVKMGFWTAIMIISVVGIFTEFIIRIVKLGIKYSENVERMQHGYPLLDGTMPINSKEPEIKEEYHN